MRELNLYILEKLKIDKDSKVNHKTQQEIEKEKYWWKNIALDNPKKYKKEELKALDIAYDFLVDKIMKIMKDEQPQEIIVFFNDEPWTLNIEHTTVYNINTYTVSVHGSSAPYRIKFSELNMNEKRSIKQILEEKTLYIYSYKKGEYILREVETYKGDKGKLLK